MIDWKDVIHRANGNNLPSSRRDERSDAQWREVLSEEQYQITRRGGTERAFSSGSCTLFEPGRYHCVCCSGLLFDAQAKFDSGSGWPSFTTPARDNGIDYILDNSHGMQRIEARCSDCDAHLGHVFPDGPAPTGLRYCMNALSMEKSEE